MSLPYKTDKWWISPYNFIETVRDKTPQPVELHDVTLRDGEEMAGVVLGIEEKIEIAQALDELGISRIEAAYIPFYSDEDRKALQKITRSKLKAKIFAVCDAFSEQEGIDSALECDVSGVMVDIPASDELLKVGVWHEGVPLTRERALDLSSEVISYAKDHDLYVVYHPFDTMRADWDFVKSLMQMAVDTHADSITVVDTFGVSHPKAFAYIVEKLKETIRIPIEVHCHNDFGLATAMALEAYDKGAEVIHTSINGIGFRCGMPPTEEIAMILNTLYNVDVGIKCEKLYDVCKLVEALSKSPVARNKPISGDSAFTFEFPFTTPKELIDSGKPQVFLPFLPQVVGRDLKVLVGKHSDLSTIEIKLEEFKITATDAQKKRMLNEVKETALKEKRAITDIEFKKIVDEIQS